jgi:putative transposase
MMRAFHQLEPRIGTAAACSVLQLNRAQIYRDRARELPAQPRPKSPRPRPPLAFSENERQQLLQILDSDRFADVAPVTIYATLLDEGRYHASVRTMYRLLAQESQWSERRRQRVHPSYEKPELLATGPNETWSWDINKIKGPVKWSHYHFYAAPETHCLSIPVQAKRPANWRGYIEAVLITDPTRRMPSP